MSLHAIAKHMASHGRDEDKMLVHMTPKEVAGLQAIALSHGGSLTINPHTGLPEAGFLKSLLPMIAGIIAAPFTAGTSLALIGPALAGAATQGLSTGDWTGKSLLGGALSGWGGGGLGTALSSAGATTATGLAAGQEAAKQAGLAAGKSLSANAGMLGAGNTLRGLGAAVMNPTTVGAQVVKETGKSKLLAGAAGAAAAKKPAKAAPTKPFEQYVTRYNPGTKNPKWGQPGEPYFIGQSYDDGYYTTDNPYTSKPPITAPTDPNYRPNPMLNYAEGGDVGDYISKINSKQTAVPMSSGQGGSPLQNYISSISTAKRQPLAPQKKFEISEPRADYMQYLQNMPGGLGQFASMRFAHGGSPDGMMRNEGAIRGDGDGMSDDVPAKIQRDDGTEHEALLADGEFVVPADVVSGLGNGSTDGGTRVLYAMMDRVRMARTGTKKQAPEIDAEKYLPA